MKEILISCLLNTLNKNTHEKHTNLSQLASKLFLYGGWILHTTFIAKRLYRAENAQKTHVSLQVLYWLLCKPRIFDARRIFLSL